MRKINLVEPTTPAWQAWKVKCAAARAAAIQTVAGGGKATVTDLYKDQKPWFIDNESPFRGKCAYCEKKINSTQRGDVEHFRPKAAVQDLQWNQVCRAVDGATETHPGYYWLAYDTSNLLLSCILCNQVYEGRLFGKGNRFPVDGDHAWEPDGEVEETALLLNPCIDHPPDHLDFDTVTGVLAGKTNKGETSIELLGLNLRDLPQERLHAFQAANDRFDNIMAQRAFRGPEWVRERLQEFVSDEVWDFTSVTRLAIKRGVGSVLQSVGGL